MTPGETSHDTDHAGSRSHVAAGDQGDARRSRQVADLAAGVVFSVVLVNLQGGLLLGMIQKASLLVDYGQADIWVGHRHMNNVDMGTFIPERWIHRIRGIEGVERAEPYVVMFGQTTMPDGRFENVVVVGCESASLLGNAWVMADGDPRGGPQSRRHPRGRLRCRPARRLPDRRCPRDQRPPGPDRGDDQGDRQLHDQPLRLHDPGPGPQTSTAGASGSPAISAPISWSRPGPVSTSRTSATASGPGAGARRLRPPDLQLDVHGILADADRHRHQLRPGRVPGPAGGPGRRGPDLVCHRLTERIKEFGTLKAMGADDRCVSPLPLAQALGNAGDRLGPRAAGLAGFGAGG